MATELHSVEFPEPWEIVQKKLALAELTIELGSVTREKWRRLDTMRDVLQREEDLIRKIAEASKALHKNENA